MARYLATASAAAALAAAVILACADPSSPTPDSTPALSPDESTAAAVTAPTLDPQRSGTRNRLQAISPVNSQVVWASGVGGTFARTTNGGQSWHAGVVPGARTLEFRDVHGVSANEAYLLAAGVGTASRIYKTVNGGQTWELQFQNQLAAAFYDCFDFWTPNRGLTFSDPVNGLFPVVRTRNGGETWNRIARKLPPALPGEFAFAASGTCVDTQGEDRGWIGTGGESGARILATTDGGNTWKAYATPIVQGTAGSGIFTVQFRDAIHGILAGGDLESSAAFSNNVAVSKNGGKTWTLVNGTPFPGAVFGLSYVPVTGPGQNPRVVVATGPGGAAWTANEGRRWHLIPDVEGFWAVAFADFAHGWLVGTEGRIVKLVF
ncbi:MAG TPA: hypothetical protein VH680_09695 [Gemmatimonadales bacterium]|jgi:photosystem II stability/assembly factor-like uncharacterized protein